jgi:hypothetical protein
MVKPLGGGASCSLFGLVEFFSYINGEQLTPYSPKTQKVLSHLLDDPKLFRCCSSRSETVRQLRATNSLNLTNKTTTRPVAVKLTY